MSPIRRCFLAIKKAYDSIWRETCLWRRGIRGKFFRILRLLYASTPSILKIGGYRTRVFYLSKGVRQGCLLSPLLSVLFFDDLTREVKQLGVGHLDELLGEIITMLLFADDIILLADSPEALQYLIDAVVRYAAAWRFEMSASKSKVMIFKQTVADKQIGHKFHLGAHDIEDTFKYLGVILTNSLSWVSMKDRLLKAAKAKQNQALTMGSIRRNFTKTTLLWLRAGPIRVWDRGVAFPDG